MCGGRRSERRAARRVATSVTSAPAKAANRCVPRPLCTDTVSRMHGTATCWARSAGEGESPGEVALSLPAHRAAERHFLPFAHPAAHMYQKRAHHSPVRSMTSLSTAPTSVRGRCAADGSARSPATPPCSRHRRRYIVDASLHPCASCWYIVTAVVHTRDKHSSVVCCSRSSALRKLC